MQPCRNYSGCKTDDPYQLLTKSLAIRKITARKKQATSDLEIIIRKYESILLNIAKRNDKESVPGCTLDTLSLNKAQPSPHTQPHIASAVNKHANNSPGGNSWVNKPCMPATQSDNIHMADLKEPFSFVKTTCNCCVSEKILTTNDIIRIPDTDKPVSKQKRDATSATNSETANIAKISPERIIP